VTLSAADEREIQSVLVRYATGIDRRDWSVFRSCFTVDFHGDYGSFGSWDGAESITTAMQAMHAALGPTLHRLSNVVIGTDGATVISRCYVDAVLQPGASGGESHQAMGYYDDLWQHTVVGWKIHNRKFTLVATGASLKQT
jgi:3-phenylpropionate/cinnamic acid dioxygenase small subunit